METATPTRPNPFEPLNAEWRLAVGYGLGEEGFSARPLPIIAGAGSGKTNTLAYPVADLILHQAEAATWVGVAPQVCVDLLGSPNRCSAPWWKMLT